MSDQIPEHESGLRHMLHQSNGTPFHPLHCMKDAIEVPDGVAIMEGDWGGTIYLTCPVRRIRCSGETLLRLLDDIDRIIWDNEGKGLYFERLSAGMGAAGGMGGGLVLDGLWLHDELVDRGLADAVEAVINGDASTLVQPDEADLQLRAAGGDAQASFWLGKLAFRRFLETRRQSDLIEALGYYRSAAASNHQGALRVLAFSLGSGKKRVDSLQKLAASPQFDQTTLHALTDLAQAFDKGEGVGVDKGQAFALYYRICHIRYDRSAAIRLGQMYLEVQGVARDEVLGLGWLYIAALESARNPPTKHQNHRAEEAARLDKLIQFQQSRIPAETVQAAEEFARSWWQDHTSKQ